jgi:hypothetical protein
MANYAVIENNIVVNAIVAESKEVAEAVTGTVCIELPEVGFGIGDTWDGEKFVKQIVEEVVND